MEKTKFYFITIVMILLTAMIRIYWDVLLMDALFYISIISLALGWIWYNFRG